MFKKIVSMFICFALVFPLTGCDELGSVVGNFINGNSYDAVLTFDANGGEGAPKEIKNWKDKSVKIPSDIPTRVGYHFLGWAGISDAQAGFIGPGDSVMMDGNKTLYAIWGNNGDSNLDERSDMRFTHSQSAYAAKLTDGIIHIYCDCGMEVTDRTISYQDFCTICNKNKSLHFSNKDESEKQRYYAIYKTADFASVALQLCGAYYGALEDNSGYMDILDDVSEISEMFGNAAKLLKDQYYENVTALEAEEFFGTIDTVSAAMCNAISITKCAYYFSCFTEDRQWSVDDAQNMLLFVEESASFLPALEYYNAMLDTLYEGLELVKKINVNRDHYDVILKASDDYAKSQYLNIIFCTADLALELRDGCCCGTGHACPFFQTSSLYEVIRKMENAENQEIYPSENDARFTTFFLAERARHEFYELTLDSDGEKLQGLTLDEYIDLMS